MSHRGGWGEDEHRHHPTILSSLKGIQGNFTKKYKLGAIKDQRWEFIKEKKKVGKQEKKKRRTRPRKRSRKKENKEENKNSTKKVIKKKIKFLFHFQQN